MLFRKVLCLLIKIRAHLLRGCFVLGGNGASRDSVVHGIESGHVTMAGAPGGGAPVALARLHQREGDSFAPLLTGGGRGRASDGRG